MRLARRQLEVTASAWAKNLHEQVTQPLRRRDGSLQDLPSFLFHRHSVAGRAVAELLVGFIIEFTDAQVGQGNLRETRSRRCASVC